MSDSIYRIPPFHYIHVLNHNSNVTRLQIGPKTFVKQDHESVVLNIQKMIIIPPQHYCIIGNPVLRDEEGEISFDDAEQAKLIHGDQEIRLTQEPFPLYPGENLKLKVTALRIVEANSALRLLADIGFTDEDGEMKVAGDEWLFEGPGTYIPRKEVKVEELVQATVIKVNQAVRLRSRRECTDQNGKERVPGEEWLVRKPGAYLHGPFEEIVCLVDAYILTEKTALHMRCLKTFTDDFGVLRKNGTEWLITMKDAESHIPGIYEEVIGEIAITTLTNRQYCVILDPVDKEGKPQYGRKKLVRGEKSFFLMPGESLEKGIQKVYVLSEDKGLILKATEEFFDKKVLRKPGDRWMIRGPAEYVPSIEVEVVCKRRAMPFAETEGVYVRDIKTGKIRAVTGQTYMLNQDEELWEKELPPKVESLLFPIDKSTKKRRAAEPSFAHFQSRNICEPQEIYDDSESVKRDKTRVVTYQIAHNSAVQIYDYKEKKSRVVFGPELVLLGPDEQFTLLSLSGDKPKRPNCIKSLCLFLGPDFCTDIITVETSDHARLSLKLSYSWLFKVDKTNPQEAAKIFSVPDFVGDSCKAIASRVRGTVASVSFDDFHRNSARIIRSSVFGFTTGKKVKEEFHFPQNNMFITSIDIQSVEPVDQRTRDSLMKSVQLAIEITTNSQEAAARHEAERLEQEARGRLERQKIDDEAEAEKTRKYLLQLQASSAAVESSGQAKAEAQSRAEAAKIEGEAAVQQAKLRSQAVSIESQSELKRLDQSRSAELDYIREQNELQIRKMQTMAENEVAKFKKMVEAIGTDTLEAVALAGPEMEIKLLKSLGLQSTLITDGSSPINLFQTAHGLINKAMMPGFHQ